MDNPTGARVAIIQTRLAPFRIPFFDRLATEGKLDVTVFCCESDGKGKGEVVTTARHFGFDVPRCFRLAGSKVSIQPSLPYRILFGKFDVVVAEARLGLVMNLVVLLLARMTGKRFLWWTCGWERSEMEAVTALKRVVRSVLFRMANGGIAYSNAAKSYLVQLGMKPSRVWVAQNSVDTDALLGVEARIRSDAHSLDHVRTKYGASGKFLVLFVGKLVGTKRVDDLIRAFVEVHKHVEQAILWIVGDGPERSSLEKLAAGLPGLPIRFLGEITEPVTINSIYMACDVFVLPGTGGLAINQAMTFGRPIVVSKADGTEEDLVADGVNGLYFEAGQIADLARKIVALERDAELRRRMGESSREKIRDSVNMTRMVESFRDAVMNRSSSVQPPHTA